MWFQLNSGRDTNKNNEDINVNKIRIICQGRVLLVELTIEALKYCVVNIYSPNNGNHDFVENVFLETLGWSREDHILMIGNWNIVLENNLEMLGILLDR